MLFLSSFDDYPLEPKEALKDLEEDVYKNRLHYAIGHCPQQLRISFRDRNLPLFIIRIPHWAFITSGELYGLFCFVLRLLELF